MITFSIKGHAYSYSIPLSAYDDDAKIIQLPNGKFYSIVGWFESNPPQPQIEEFTKLVKPWNPIKAMAIK